MNNEIYMIITALFGFAVAQVISHFPLNTNFPFARKLKELYDRKTGPK